MLQALADQIQSLLGYDRNSADVSAVHMALRALVIYGVTLVLIRLGSRRLLSHASAFDIIVGIMIGSVMSRAINSSAPLFPTVAAGSVMIGLHWLLGALTFRARWFGAIVKGNPLLLIQDGVLQHREMQRAGISMHDLQQAVRLQAHTTDVATINTAYVERNGDISVIPRTEHTPIVDVSVADGVQTVRIHFD